MKQFVAGLFTALSMYSVIPTPKTEWNRDSMRYALCFLPLIGVLIGVVTLLWYQLCRYLGAAAGLFAAVSALLPILISGGIHMDGFLDTSDAVSSHALREKKLEILKDTHVGAFAVLFCGGYLLLSFGLWQQLYERPRLMALAALGCVASRCFDALSIAIIPPARASGLVRLFSDAAAKRAVVAVVGICLVLVYGVGLWVSPLWGAVAAVVTLVYGLLHRRWCLWEFGGNTGDLAGYLLQVVELLYLAVAAVGGLLA